MSIRMRARVNVGLVCCVTTALGALPSGGRAQLVGRVDVAEIFLPVATHRLARGMVLGADDFVEARVAYRGPSAPRRTPVAAGWVTRRVIQSGEVLRAPAVAPAPLVAAGQRVLVTYQQGGFALTLDGVAPVAGSLGDTIPVRLGARRRIAGVVTGPARVIAIDLVRTP